MTLPISVLQLRFLQLLPKGDFLIAAGKAAVLLHFVWATVLKCCGRSRMVDCLKKPVLQASVKEPEKLRLVIQTAFKEVERARRVFQACLSWENATEAFGLTLTSSVGTGKRRPPGTLWNGPTCQAGTPTHSVPFSLIKWSLTKVEATARDCSMLALAHGATPSPGSICSHLLGLKGRKDDKSWTIRRAIWMLLSYITDSQSWCCFREIPNVLQLSPHSGSPKKGKEKNF